MKISIVNLRIGNAVLVIALMLGSIAINSAGVQAQEGSQRIMLPLIQSGQPSAQSVTGPFADIPDPSNAVTSDSGADLSETDLVALGGSCYWGNGSGRSSFTPRAGSTFSYDWVGGKDTSSCRDINIHVQVQKPWARGCKVDVSILANNRRYDPHVAPNRWYAPVRGLWTSNWSGLVGVTGACGRTTVYWAS